MSIKHKQKVSMARKMMSNIEKKLKTPIFQSKQWKNKKQSTENRITTKIKKNGKK